MNVFQIGDSCTNIFHDRGDFVFQKATSKNMEILWRHFHSKERYPEFYRGIAKKVAICKCPKTGSEEWFNGEDCLSVDNPEEGSIVTVKVIIGHVIYTRDFIFTGWVRKQVHEWKMTKGKNLLLEQSFIDALHPQDKRYLKINH
jgi:hypothetical protein